ncbi:hypothetical protein JN01_0685 [Entomoplasma freundtii]|uniref:Uncharacterized protein n=1 Tax=Entomoplasma freundtii TaxID=74700 RepID=A0A2K8NRK8_9MOLU|nr:hypothetical protein [Entomoplasma freundtii]ATZ16470.1 hypothetical protein EFREU_v1c04440 [Entomoplasma freundtii]TDY55999.1 hypothetical protein JN01_0685 [Entomoplasma freundtii]
MKKWPLFLSSLMIMASPALTIACKQNIDNNLIKDEPIIPSYNLKEALLTINELEFQRQYPNLNLSEWEFQNSWFDNFETNNSLLNLENLTKTEGTRLEEKKIKEFKYENKNNENENWTTPKINVNIPYKEKTSLINTDVKLDIDQNFYIINKPNLSFYKYSLLKNRLEEMKENQPIEEFEIQSKTITVPKNSTVKYFVKLNLLISQFDVILNFNMRNNTSILTKIQNLKNAEIKFMSYNFETLLKEAENDDKYYQVLTNEQGFLKIKKSKKYSIDINLKGRLEMIESWQIFQGEEDGY